MMAKHPDASGLESKEWFSCSLYDELSVAEPFCQDNRSAYDNPAYIGTPSNTPIAKPNRSMGLAS